MIYILLLIAGASAVYANMYYNALGFEKQLKEMEKFLYNTN